MFTRKVFILILVALLVLSVGSCTPKKVYSPVDVPPQTKNLETVEQSIRDTSESIDESADSIDKEIQGARTDSEKIESPKSLIAILSEYYDNVNFETTHLRELSDELDKSRLLLQESTSKVSQLETGVLTLKDEYNKILKEKEKLEKEKSDRFVDMLAWVGIVGVIGLGACVAVGVMGRIDIALAGAALFGTFIAVAIFVKMFMLWIGIGVGILVLSLIGYMLYKFINKSKELSHLDKVSEELISTVEVNKTAMTPEARQKMFGSGPTPGQIDIIQSKDTKNYVKEKKSQGQIKLATKPEAESIQKKT